MYWIRQISNMRYSKWTVIILVTVKWDGDRDRDMERDRDMDMERDRDRDMDIERDRDMDMERDRDNSTRDF
jgi:hypothetical protein